MKKQNIQVPVIHFMVLTRRSRTDSALGGTSPASHAPGVCPTQGADCGPELADRPGSLHRSLFAVLFLLVTSHAFANGGAYEIEADTEVTLGAGDQLDLDCNDFRVAGTFHLQSGRVDSASDVTIPNGGTIDGGSGILDVNGNWTNQGSFQAGTGRVQLMGACTTAPIHVTGATTFCHLDLSNTGLDYVFPAGQTLFIQCSLNLGQGNRIRATDGGKAYIQLGPNATVTGMADLDQVVIRQDDPVPIPTMSSSGLVALGLLLAALAARRRGPRPRSSGTSMFS